MIIEAEKFTHENIIVTGFSVEINQNKSDGIRIRNLNKPHTVQFVISIWVIRGLKRARIPRENMIRHQNIPSDSANRCARFYRFVWYYSQLWLSRKTCNNIYQVDFPTCLTVRSREFRFIFNNIRVNNRNHQQGKRSEYGL